MVSSKTGKYMNEAVMYIFKTKQQNLYKICECLFILLVLKHYELYYCSKTNCKTKKSKQKKEGLFHPPKCPLHPGITKDYL